MNRRTWGLAAGVVGVAGFAAVAVGTWLPWLVVRPGYNGPVPAIHLPAMDSGFAGLDWLAISVAATALLGVIPTDRIPVALPDWLPVRAALWTILAGGFVVALTVYSLLSTGFLGVFVPGAGFYLTALGGVHLSVGGALRLHAVTGE